MNNENPRSVAVFLCCVLQTPVEPRLNFCCYLYSGSSSIFALPPAPFFRVEALECYASCLDPNLYLLWSWSRPWVQNGRLNCVAAYIPVFGVFGDCVGGIPQCAVEW